MSNPVHIAPLMTDQIASASALEIGLGKTPFASVHSSSASSQFPPPKSRKQVNGLAVFSLQFGILSK